MYRPMYRLLSFLTILLLLSIQEIANASTVRSQLEWSRSQIRTKNYEGAIKKTKPLLDRLLLNTVEEIILAHKILGVSYCELGDQGKTTEHFKALLVFSPNEAINDMVATKPCAEMYRNLQEIERNPKGISTKTPYKPLQPTSSVSATQAVSQEIPVMKAIEKSPESISTPKTFEHSSPDDTWKRYVPFGVGQFANQDFQKGMAFLGTEVLATIVASTAFALFQLEKTSDGTFSHPNRASFYRATYWSSLGVGSVIMIWGIVDAVTVFHQRRNLKTPSMLEFRGPFLTLKY